MVPPNPGRSFRLQFAWPLHDALDHRSPDLIRSYRKPETYPVFTEVPYGLILTFETKYLAVADIDHREYPDLWATQQ